MNRKGTRPSGPRKRGRREATKTGRVVVENVNTPGRTTRVNEVKYAAMRRALLRVLPSRAPGLTQAEMFKAVRGHLPESIFPGGATSNWWAKTVQLDLEAKGLVRRAAESRPLRWHRTGRSR